jgi:TPR repeat protein
MKRLVVPVLILSLVAVATWVYFQRKGEISTPTRDPTLVTEAVPDTALPSSPTNTSAQAQPAQASSSDAQHLNREVTITSANLAKDWAQLQDTAKRDPAFAYALILKLHECRMVANTFGGIEKLNSATVAANQNASGIPDDVKAKAAVCADLTPAQYMAYVDMIEFAAASGIVKAQVDYSNLIAPTILTDESIKNPKRIEEYRAKSMRYFHSAAQAGYAPALQALSFAYSDGYVTAKDDYAAYKYLHAYSLAAPRRTPSLDKLLIRFQIGLTQQQITAAQREATTIYNTCCRK